LLRLPPEIQEMIRSREIDRLDVAYRLSMIRDPDRQREAARQLGGAHSKEVRDVAGLLANTDLDMGEARRRVLRSQLRGLHIVVLHFDNKEHRAIVSQARAAGLPPAEFVRRIVTEGLNEMRRKLKETESGKQEGTARPSDSRRPAQTS
jgi:hypothetical protein